MFRTPDGAVLLMRRGASAVDHPGVWALPAGHAEDDDVNPEATARREAEEETGYTPGEDVKLLHATETFHTFLAEVEAPFPVTLNEEHTGHMWASPEDIRSMSDMGMTHPGLADPLAIAGIETELHVAELIQQGVLASPQHFGNVWLFDIRITGTGTAYRSALKEHVYRPPENYLNPEFLQRCNGLPVIMEHPDDAILSSAEYHDRNIGSVFLPYIRGDEVWAIAKIFDDTAAQMMVDGQLSTSPSVVFQSTGDNSKIILDNGEALLIEGIPALLDHIAICKAGVWDKGGEPNGVSITNGELPAMTPEELAAKAKTDAEAAAKKRADEDSGKIDETLAAVKVLADGLGGLAKRMDAFEKKADSGDGDREEKEEKADKARKDAEEIEAKKKADEAEEEKKAADKKKADAEAEAAERPAMADAQAKCDSALAAFGQHARRPLQGERLRDYRISNMVALKDFSPTYKPLEASAFDAFPDAALDIAERTIYADAALAARTAADVQEGTLLEVKAHDAAGRTVSTFRGKPSAWLNQFKSQRRSLVGINKQTRH